jgi:hypothetical protein
MFLSGWMRIITGFEENGLAPGTPVMDLCQGAKLVYNHQ